MTFAQRLGTTLLIVVTTIGAMFTFLVAGGSGTLNLVGVRLIYIVMAAVTLIPWLTIAIIRPSWRPSSRLAPPLLLCIIVVAISTITSRIPRLSLEMLGYIVLLIEIYLLLVALMRRPALRLHLQRLALVMCVVLGVLFLMQVLQTWQIWWGLVGHVAIPPLRPGYLGLTIGPNPITTVVLILGSFGLATSTITGRLGLTIAILVAGLITAISFITGSRGAWLGLCLGVIVVLGTSFFVQPETRRRASGMARSRASAVAIAVAVPIVAVAAALAALSGRLTLEGGAARAGFARASLKMFESAPITGVGPGTWGPLRASYTVPNDPDQYIPHAHNIYFQILAEYGLVGVIAAVVMAAALGILILRSVRSEDPIRRRVAFATLFGSMVLAGQQLADMLMNVPAVLLSIGLAIAWLDATSPQPATEREPPSARRSATSARLVNAAAAAMTLAIFVGLLRIETIASVAAQGVDAANAGNWSDAARFSGEAAAEDPNLNLYRFQVGVSAADAGDLRLAEQALQVSATNDDYRYAWLDLAAVRWQLGDPAGARQALLRAERLGLQRTAVAAAAGWLRQELGDGQAATDDYASALSQTPTLVDDAFWTSGSGPPGGLGPILEAVKGLATPETMLQIHLVLGQIDAAQQEVGALTSADPTIYPLLIPAWTGDAAAWMALQAEAARRTLDPGPANWCRLVATYKGDAVLARMFSARLAITNSPDYSLPIVGRLVFDSAEPLPNYILDGYGDLYRRPVPNAQVVRLLPQVVLQDHP